MDSAGSSEVPRVPIQVTRGCLFASLNVELQQEGWSRFHRDLLERIRTAAVPGIVLDLSGVEVLDSQDFEAIRRAVAMATMMGARTVLAGLRPGVVSSLIGMDVDLDGLEAVATSDDAFDVLTAAGRDNERLEIEQNANGDSDPHQE